MLGWEFKFDGTPPDSHCFAGAIGLMDAAIEKTAGEEKDVWFSGLVGEDDFASLKEMATAKSNILFPGVMMGWEDKEKAISHLATLGQNAK